MAGGAGAVLRDLVRVVPDYPKPGISFKDLTTLLKDGGALRAAIDAMHEPFAGQAIDLIVGIESRGFILGAPLAVRLGCGFVPVRKPGKLPAETLRQEYQLEYGRDALEIHRDAIEPGQHVLVVDDLLATGGTTGATCRLVERLEGRVVGLSFLVELTFLAGRERLRPYRVESVMGFPS
ncbi:MAG: adenine phosphoribosyltransferase [Candidatus Latescibacterota bacterium]